MVKRVLGIFFALMMVTSNALAWFSMSGLRGLWRGEADNYQRQVKAGYGHLPQGLTFYKDFSKIPAGTYTGTTSSSWLNADYSIGSPLATYTSTDGTFTITSKGLSCTTANDTVLKFATLLNRTAAQETIIIKFTPTGDFANDGVNRYLFSTDTKDRRINKFSTLARMSCRANIDDSPNCFIDGSSTTYTDGLSYVYAISVKQTSPYISAYRNGVLDGTETEDNFTVNAWGNSFYIGAYHDGNNQLGGIIEKIWIYSRTFSMSEIAIHS